MSLFLMLFSNKINAKKIKAFIDNNTTGNDNIYTSNIMYI